MAMLFHQGMFSPETATDARVRAVLQSALEHAPALLRPCDLVAGVIRQGDDRLLATLRRAVWPGASLQEVFHAGGNGRADAGRDLPAPRARESFSPRALEA